ncbi:MAG: pitrilysin family protein [Bacteroidota bacterium]
MMEYDLMTLPNGIRVVHKQVSNTKIAHCGIMLDIGSRDEAPDQQGIAHFWEHMAFKGTQKRKSYHILSRIDSLGGELNAYTTKEKICFYSAVMDSHLDKSVELLSDITFHSIFPEKHIEKERGVIIEEMAMYRDNPEDAIQDEFDEVLFGDRQLGKNILGNEDSVGGFTREDFERFVQENLNTDKVIFSSVGSYSAKKIFRLAEKYLSDIPTVKTNKSRSKFDSYLASNIERLKPTYQAQCVMGTTAYGLSDEKRLPFFLLVNLLGGPGMNSRLNLAIREKYGFVYSIEAHYSPYIDTGALGIFFGTDGRHAKRVYQLVQKELEKLRTKPLGELQLHKAKEQLRGQLAMSEENNNSIMLMLSKSLLDLGEVRSLEQVFALIDRVNQADLMGVANEILEPSRLSTLTYLPEN